MENRGWKMDLQRVCIAIFYLPSSIFYLRCSIQHTGIPRPPRNLTLVQVFQQRQSVFAAAAKMIAKLRDDDAPMRAILPADPCDHLCIGLRQKRDVVRD